MAENNKVSLRAIQQGVLPAPDHQSKEIIEYVEGQLNKGTRKRAKVTHLEKIKTEVVSGIDHVAWDVHTDKQGRWWVITGPTNLYSQKDFPSLDYTLSFHVGVTARLASRDANQGPNERKGRLRATWRKWETAATSLDAAEEPEDFQAVGMMCRESLVELAKNLQPDLPVPPSQEPPKAADFVGWSELAANHFAAGKRNERIRGYLKSTSKETWQLANWLTHTGKASLYEAHLVLDATGNLLSMFSLVVMKNEAGTQDSCPRCHSYRVVAVFEPDLGLDPPYINLCEACGWNSYEADDEAEEKGSGDS